MADDLNLSLYKNRTFADVTFVFDGKEVKAHKCVLADRCDYFKQYFNQNKSSVINMNETSMKLFEEVVKFCYLRQIDLSDWSYDDKECLHELATAYKYGPMIDFVQKELDKRPEVPLSVDTLNEWHKNSPGEELSEWIESNLLDIVNYEDCHKYSQDLILLILDTFNEMFDWESKYELRTAEKQLLKWLFRWRNWCNREEADAQNLFSKAKLQLVLKKQTLGDKVLQKKLSIETNDGLFLMPDSVAFTAKYETAIKHFLIFRKLDTNGWTCDEILQLLGCAHVYDFSPLIDAVLNVVATQYLEPSSFAAIYDIAHQLEPSKLEQVLVDYLRNNINSIFASAEFTNYPVRVVGFIFQNLSAPTMEVNTKRLIVTSIKKWMDSNGQEEVKKVPNFAQFSNFVLQLTTDIFSESFNDDHSKDVTFVFGKEEIKAHKWVLASSCDNFKVLLDKGMNIRIKMEGIRIEPFNQLIKHCYKQKIDLTVWGFSEKKYLYDLATKYKCRSLMDLVKCELEKRPKVPLGVESLNEWYGNCPDEEIREWVKNNLLNIVNYEDCHKYSNDLVVLIMDTFCELADLKTDKENLETPLKKLIQWLCRWRNSSTRKEEDVQSLFAKIRLPLVLEDRASMDKTLEKKLFEAVRRFCHIREVDTAGWTLDDVLELLYFAHDYEFGPLLDALVNAVATKYLKPASLEKIHDLTTRLQCNKLQQMIAVYLKNNTMNILTSAEFTNYPVDIVELVLETLKNTGMDMKKAHLMLTSVWKWKTSKSDKDVKLVFNKIRNFPRNQFADIFDHLFIDDDSKDVTFVFGETTILAHKMVIAYSFDYYHSQLLDQSLNTVIKIDGTSIVLFRQVVKFCYNQMMDIAHWSYNKKCDLLTLAKSFNYQSLMDFLETELKKRPESRISVMNLNEWFEMSPIQEINDWVEKRLFLILRNEHCGHYSKDLVLFIMETLYKMYGEAEDKRKFQDSRERLLPWLFCWKNSANKLDVFTVFGKVKWNLVPHKQLVNMTVVSMEKTSPDLWPHPLTEHSEFRGTKRKHE